MSWFNLTKFCTTVRVSKQEQCFRALLKAGRVGIDDRIHGSAFQILEATDENDMEVAMLVLCGEHIDRDEEERNACDGTYRGMTG